MLWSLHRRGCTDYDELRGCVVRAPSEIEARYLASLEAGDEGKSIWMKTEETECRRIKVAGKCGVLLVDFKKG